MTCVARAFVTVTALSGVLAITGRAAAGPQCLGAYEEGEQLREAGKLIAARESYSRCVDDNDSCPEVVKKECATAADELRAQIPSIVISMTDAAGRDVPAAQYSLDGAPFAPSPPTFVELDPGPHDLRVTSTQGEARIQFNALAAQRGRVITLALPAPAAAAKPLVPPAAAPAAAPRRSLVLPAALLGVAAIGAGGFIGFGLHGNAQRSTLEKCRPDCAMKDVDSMRRTYLFADVSLGVSLVSVGLAGYFFLTGKPRERASETRTWNVTVLSSRDGGRLVVSGAL